MPSSRASGCSDAPVSYEESSEPERKPERQQADPDVQPDRGKREADDRDDEQDVGETP
jgi:hypothetical protein